MCSFKNLLKISVYISIFFSLTFVAVQAIATTYTGSLRDANFHAPEGDGSKLSSLAKTLQNHRIARTKGLEAILIADIPMPSNVFELASTSKIPVIVHLKEDSLDELVKALEAHPDTIIVWADTKNASAESVK